MRRFGHVHTPGNIDERGYCQTALVVALERAPETGIVTTVTALVWSRDGTQSKRRNVAYREETVFDDQDSYHPEQLCPFGR